MQGTPKSTGPLALTNTYTTNVFNPSTNTVAYLKQVIVTNKTASAATFRLYKGATGANTAGTELFFDKSVPANDVFTYYFQPGLQCTTTDFIVGGASAVTTLTITLIYEVVGS
jgi:hypothetical protein